MDRVMIYITFFMVLFLFYIQLQEFKKGKNIAQMLLQLCGIVNHNADELKSLGKQQSDYNQKNNYNIDRLFKRDRKLIDMVDAHSDIFNVKYPVSAPLKHILIKDIENENTDL